MTLLGTLLLPCLALTKDLANAAAAFSVHAAGVGTALPPVDPVEPSRFPPAEIQDVHGSATSNEAQSSGNETTAIAESVLSPAPPASENLSTAVQQQPAATVKAGTGLGRPVLVTALEFLSPYPLVMATSTGGAVPVWRTSDCVCVQVNEEAADL